MWPRVGWIIALWIWLNLVHNTRPYGHRVLEGPISGRTNQGDRNCFRNQMENGHNPEQNNNGDRSHGAVLWSKIVNTRGHRMPPSPFRHGEDRTDWASSRRFRNLVSDASTCCDIENHILKDCSKCVFGSTVDLASLEIAEIEPDALSVADQLGSVTTLTLADNRLVEIPEDVFSGMSSLETLWVLLDILGSIGYGPGYIMHSDDCSVQGP
eukprot:gb/GECG01012911.1/.p1 GENE.gb/GECG01012911.1/~~gb/GECG01012911.1/.p1  ORF type:complete len:211 (+),score=7.91 gb/GECG01012911.1/:1-633(+)